MSSTDDHTLRAGPHHPNARRIHLTIPIHRKHFLLITLTTQASIMKFLAIAQVFTAFAIAATSAAETNHLRKLTIDTSKGFLETKPAPEECESGERYCTCRDGSACTTSDECVE
jgi:hypothetical protein